MFPQSTAGKRKELQVDMLNDIPDVETKSEGEGLYKQVRVIYKGIR